MNYEEKYKEIFDMKKEDLLYLIENLMIEGKLDISDITLCHTKFLENKLAMKEEIIHQADTKSFADAWDEFFKSGHGVNSMHIDSIEKV